MYTAEMTCSHAAGSVETGGGGGDDGGLNRQADPTMTTAPPQQSRTGHTSKKKEVHPGP